MVRTQSNTASIAVEAIASRILELRRQRVLLDADLAALYGVTTKRLNEQVKRNPKRFPADFMFRLSPLESENLNRSQIATGSRKHRDPRFFPYAFTEHGALMAASILNSQNAVEVSLFVVRAFVQLRGMLGAHKELAKRLDQLESQVERRLSMQDQTIVGILDAVRALMTPPEPKRRSIGFITTDENPSRK